MSFAPINILLCSPDCFEVRDEKNVHMVGHAGSTDRQEARHQWESLKSIYETLRERGIVQELEVIPGAEDCEDMVFCANQSFPWQLKDGSKIVVMSRMRHASRQREVIHFEQFFERKGFRSLHLKTEGRLEGMGDLIPHPGRRLIYGGYGHRSSKEIYEELSKLLETEIVPLELGNPAFYHLDTCFVPLSESSVMLCEKAFTPEGLEVISRSFSKLYSVSVEEAISCFSLNAHAFEAGNRRIAILQQGSVEARHILETEGFEIVETDTSEFMKSGGSVFCMKMAYP